MERELKKTAVSKITVCLAQEQDYQRILNILNLAIYERKVTALLTPVTLESRKNWFKEHQDGIHPIYVAKINNLVVGWMAVTAYRSGREGFKHASEISYYMAPEYRECGVGTALMDHVILESRKRGLKNLMALIFADNLGSQRLAFKYGFEIWGKFPNIVEIDGRTTDCYQMGLKL
ncbi:MAG: N-acetyltransferase family protein [Eubacterium sp.]